MSGDDRGSLPSPAEPTNRRASKSGYRIFLLVVLALGAAGTTGLLLAHKPQQTPETAKGVPDGTAPSKELKEFKGQYLPSWPADRKPELVLLFTGQQHNYEAPCGCTEPQFGGLERRYNLITKLREFGLPTVTMDLGDIYYPSKLKLQAELKYRMAMKALAVMQYDAVAIGPEETRIPLLDALANTILQHNYPFGVLAANITNKADYPGLNGSMIEDFRVAEPKGSALKVGVVGIFGPSAIEEIKKIDSSIQFGKNPAALNGLKAKNPDLRVLLYQGTLDEAKELVQNVDEFDVVLCRTMESEPRGKAEFAPPAPGQQKPPRAQLVQVGHKGRYVGVMAVFRDANNGLDLKWDLVALGPDFKTDPAVRDKHPMIGLLEGYTKQMKDEDFLDKYPKLTHPTQVQFTKNELQPIYVGSKACAKCHAQEYQTWLQSRHAGAYQTLSANPKSHPPHNRQFDGECIVCHTTGFGYRTGFRDRLADLTDADKSKHLFGVGCENCHGPGSLHADDPRDKQYRAALSPWREKPGEYLSLQAIEEGKDKEKDKKIPPGEMATANRVFRLCFQCHDTDNDHDFSLEKWKKIAHGAGPTGNQPKK